MIAEQYLNNFSNDKLQLEELNIQFVKEYQQLERYFPGSVRHRENTFIVDGHAESEFYFGVGQPMKAQDLFQGRESLEVGGPSDYDKLKTVKGTFKPSLVTNIKPMPGIDHLADATSLHYPNKSFDVIVAVALNGRTSGYYTNETSELRTMFIKESYRTLKPGGILLMAGADMKDLSSAISMGFGVSYNLGCIRSRLAVTKKNDQYQPYHDIEFLMHK